MSTSQTHTSSTDTSDSDDPTPALGCRENFWGEDDRDGAGRTGHSVATGTDPAEFVAHQLALELVDPICGETGGALSEPIFYLPKQIEIADGQFLEYRQHQHRRRFNPETGFINWGETTTTAVPEFDYSVYKRAVHTYLASRDFRLPNVDEYLKYAEQVWGDPSMGSKDSLAQFVEYVRDREDPE